jgi:hypothetical protein
MTGFVCCLRWTLLGALAGGVLGFVGLWMEFRVFNPTSDPAAIEWQNFSLIIGTGLCAGAGLGLGAIYGAARASESPVLSVIPSSLVGALIGCVMAGVFPFVWDYPRVGLMRMESWQRTEVVVPGPRRPKSDLGPKVIGGLYHTGYGLQITLNRDGGYSAYHYGQCGMIYGEAAGRWSVSKTTLTLAPVTERGTMKGRLGTLQIVDLGERVAFVRPIDLALFVNSGADHVKYFQREDQFTGRTMTSAFGTNWAE